MNQNILIVACSILAILTIVGWVMYAQAKNDHHTATTNAAAATTKAAAATAAASNCTVKQQTCTNNTANALAQAKTFNAALIQNNPTVTKPKYKYKKSNEVFGPDKLTKLINGPISKTHFLKKKFPGITEYIGSKTNSKDLVMLIYNQKLAVCPLTTHIPIKHVAKLIKKKKIINTAVKIHNFYRSKLRKLPKLAILGLNPHCETIDKVSEEKKEIIPAIKFLRNKKISVSGPFSADTFFLTKNIKKFDVVIGMYHDQVLTPIKTLYKFDAINITIGLPFIKVTPDHGPNHEMIGKNKSDSSSIIYALNFLEKIR